MTNFLVLFLDVSKAFDSAWTENLFFQLHELGVTVRTCRLMYRTYIDFKCKVRVYNKTSEWYPMMCGIHQGGFLSLIKYVIFINSLLKDLELSKLCCTIYNIKTSPIGYADDLAAACLNKRRIDKVLEIVHLHSVKWRYYFNADKSSILVYGETQRENSRNKVNRSYKLGSCYVKEKSEYDHVGFKTCILRGNNSRTVDKISKGRRTLNAAAGLGIKKAGLTISSCNVSMWLVIIPIITYAAELWVLKQSDVKIIDEFQRYAGRRIQRFPRDSPNETSFVGLGWMRLENFICVKKLLFLRTTVVREETCVYKRVLLSRADVFNNDIRKGIENLKDSPIFEILRISVIYKLYDEVMRMIHGTVLFSKEAWKNRVWKTEWAIENEDWAYRLTMFKSVIRVKRTSGEIWWFPSDKWPKHMKCCEIMAKLICQCSKLKSDDTRLKRSGRVDKMCTLCKMFEVESLDHMLLHCTAHTNIRSNMFNAINDMKNGIGVYILANSDNLIDTIMGKPVDTVAFEHVLEFWMITSSFVSVMYYNILRTRHET